MEAGKHIFVEKPLTYTVHEARALADIAQRTGVVTQMGNQGHSGDSARLVNEWVQAGVIGDVTEVHIWTNRPIWPQGIHRPERVGGRTEPRLVPAVAPGRHPVRRGGRDGCGVRGTRGHGLGPVSRADHEGHPLPPRLSSLQLARLGRLRGQRSRRHGRAPGRPPLLGPRPHLPHHRRSHLHPLGRPAGRPRFLPAGHARALRVPGPRLHAGRRPPLVRRRSHAPAPGRTPRRRRSQPHRRRDVRRRPRHPHARHLRSEPAPLPRVARRRGRRGPAKPSRASRRPIR